MVLQLQLPNNQLVRFSDNDTMTDRDERTMLTAFFHKNKIDMKCKSAIVESLEKRGNERMFVGLHHLKIFIGLTEALKRGLIKYDDNLSQCLAEAILPFHFHIRLIDHFAISSFIMVVCFSINCNFDFSPIESQLGFLSHLLHPSLPDDAGTGHAGTGHAGTGHAGTGHAGTGHAGTGHAGTGHAGTGHAGTGHAGTGHAGTGHAGTGHAGTGHAGTGHAGTGHAGTGHIPQLIPALEPEPSVGEKQ
ncbi:hypothetical protein OSB04_024481 [Centaurea solstitialis]|uniref:Uncharacterized protein n=1 Tax=Centaurea solstitialis TaxID=347529 RepID=A0AA38WC41_9ASTR|nr:hypothetical protein OSB04_024481 [Centaurea solstitialis]